MSCGIGRRPGSDPALLWLCCRLAAIPPIGPLAWEPPYAAGAASPRAKQKNEKKRERENGRMALGTIWGTFFSGFEKKRNSISVLTLSRLDDLSDGRI